MMDPLVSLAMGGLCRHFKMMDQPVTLVSDLTGWALSPLSDGPGGLFALWVSVAVLTDGPGGLFALWVSVAVF